MSDFGAPPVIPTDLQQYNSYLTDPQWARKFSIIWASVLAGFVVWVAGPALVRSCARLANTGVKGAARTMGREIWREMRARVGGVWEDWDVDVHEHGWDVDENEIDYRGGDTMQEASQTKSTGQSNVRRRKSGGVGLRVLRTTEDILRRAGAVFLWTVPGLGLNAGQILLVVGYILTVVLCIVLEAPLMSNSNRAGFIALAQLPPLFLFASKNSVFSLLLPSPSASSSFSYEKINFLHRWSGRLLFLGALLHGALWIRNHLIYGIEIVGAQKEESGIAAFAMLGVIVLTSVRAVRRRVWGVFWVGHVLAFPAFFITLCYHTIYAAPWIFPPLAFYGLDLLLRMFKHRILDAVLVPVDGQMTLVHIPHITAGWRAGQHIRLRIFAAGGARVFESHPLSIYTAPPDVSCIRPESMPALSAVPFASSSSIAAQELGDDEKQPQDENVNVNENLNGRRIPRGMSLGIRAVGDWSRAVNAHARAVGEEMREQEEEEARYRDEKSSSSPSTSASSSPNPNSTSTPNPDAGGLSKAQTQTSPTPTPIPVPVQIMLDGPYGGASVDLGEYETVLLFAGGAGATFTLGLLDDIVGRCVSRPGRDGGRMGRMGRRGGERTRRVEFAWCVRSFGSIEWFAPALMDIARAAASSHATATPECPPLDLHISIYVTCLCNPEAVPPIPNCDVTIVRPSVVRMVRDLTTPPPPSSKGAGGQVGKGGKTRAGKTVGKEVGGKVVAKSIPPMSRPGVSSSVDETDIEEVGAADVDVYDDDDEDEDEDLEQMGEVDSGVVNVGTRLPWPSTTNGGGLAVCASGPESLVREAANAVARLKMSRRGRKVGRVGLHTEVFMV